MKYEASYTKNAGARIVLRAKLSKLEEFTPKMFKSVTMQKYEL